MKCERTVIPKGEFHPQSFRWSKRGPISILVGCRKQEERGGKKMATKWGGPKGAQCRFVSGGKAGMRAHTLIVPAKGGGCRPNYKAKR
jgi:hypothetical protein